MMLRLNLYATKVTIPFLRSSLKIKLNRVKRKTICVLIHYSERHFHVTLVILGHKDKSLGKSRVVRKYHSDPRTFLKGTLKNIFLTRYCRSEVVVLCTEKRTNMHDK